MGKIRYFETIAEYLKSPLKQKAAAADRVIRAAFRGIKDGNPDAVFCALGENKMDQGMLLAKMENSQFSRAEVVDVITVLNEQLPYLESLSEGFMLKNDSQSVPMSIKANRSLLESLINNLVVNAVRHNKPEGEIIVVAKENYLTVSNTSNEKALDEKLIFNRFYSPSGETKGCGLGLLL